MFFAWIVIYNKQILTIIRGIFQLISVILPYKNVSPYEALTTNFYDYAKQINVLRERPDFVIAPAKVLTEKLHANLLLIDYF